MSSGQDAAEYLRERRIVELFESLTAALAHDQPSQPLDFIIHNLDRARQIGCENIFWDSFLPPSGSTPRLSPAAPLPDQALRRHSRSVVTRSRSTLQSIGEGDVMSNARHDQHEKKNKEGGGVAKEVRSKLELRRSFKTTSSTLESNSGLKMLHNFYTESVQCYQFMTDSSAS